MLAGVAAAARWLLAAATLAAAPKVATGGVAEGQRVDRDVDVLVQTARSRHLAETRDWQVLLHYRRRGSGWKSEADGPGFFLAGAAGQRDPAAELSAALRAFFAPGPLDDEHAQCRFPARWAWLQQMLAIDAGRAPHPVCAHYDFWRTGIAAQAATLVYATAFINSPASMYGHTFLRLSRATGEGNPLLDYIVNFAADVDTKNGVLYAVKGLTGGFPGRFYTMPYYFKVQEYSNIESRDLWEYELSLSPQQVRRLVMHAWEMRSIELDYLFLTRNCSYQLLSLLEVADPNLHLTDQFHGFVIPADTVRAVLATRGLVRRISGRPSLMTILQQHRARLMRAEARTAAAWATAMPGAPVPPLPVGATPERQARILDAATDYLRFLEHGAEPGELDKLRERRLLLARGRLGVPPQETVVRPAVAAPETGHPTMRITAGGGVADQGGPFQTLSWRVALHDDLDPARGYPSGARLQMGALRLRFQDRPRRPELDRLDMLDIVSAAPFDAWVKSASWMVWAGVDNAREVGCERPGSSHAGWRCLYGGATTGGGIALTLGRSAATLLLLAETDLGAGPAFAGAHDFRLGAGGEARLAGGGNRWRFELDARGIYYALGARGPVLRTRALQSLLLNRTFAVRFGAETTGSYAQASAELAAYF